MSKHYSKKFIDRLLVRAKRSGVGIEVAGLVLEKKYIQANKLVKAKEDEIKAKRHIVPIEQNTFYLATGLLLENEIRPYIYQKNLGKGHYLKTIIHPEFSKPNPQDFIEFIYMLVASEMIKTDQQKFQLDLPVDISRIFKTRDYFRLKGYKSAHDVSGKEYEQFYKTLDALSYTMFETNYFVKKSSTDSKQVFTRTKRDKEIYRFITKYGTYKDRKYIRIWLDPYVEHNLRFDFHLLFDVKKLKDLKGNYAPILFMWIWKTMGKKNYMDSTIDFILSYLGLDKKYNDMAKKYKTRNVKRYIIPALEQVAMVLRQPLNGVNLTAKKPHLDCQTIREIIETGVIWYGIFE